MPHLDENIFKWVTMVAAIIGAILTAVQLFQLRRYIGHQLGKVIK